MSISGFCFFCIVLELDFLSITISDSGDDKVINQIRVYPCGLVSSSRTTAIRYEHESKRKFDLSQAASSVSSVSFKGVVS